MQVEALGERRRVCLLMALNLGSRRTLCYAIVLTGRKSGFRARFRPDCYRESTEIGPPAGPARAGWAELRQERVYTRLAGLEPWVFIGRTLHIASRGFVPGAQTDKNPRVYTRFRRSAAKPERVRVYLP